MERKASEIILDLESKIDLLLKIAHNQDMTIKIILDRVNKLYSASEQKIIVNKNIPEDTGTNEFVEEESFIEVEEVPAGSRRTSRPETYNPEKSATDNKVAVSQKVLDVNKKDIFMAEVIVSDAVGIVHKTKTNAVGKWQAYLKPGKYQVTISKNDSISKKRIEDTQMVEIAASNSPIKLQNLIIKK